MRTLLTIPMLISLTACGAVGHLEATASIPTSPSSPGSSALRAAGDTRTGLSVTTATTHPSTAVQLACSNAAVLATWSLTRLAAQVVVVPVNESQVSSLSSEVGGGAGGVILFGVSAPAGLAADLHRLSALAPGGVAPLVMTDEEGGDVQRMANLVGSIPSAREMGATMTPEQIRTLATGLGRRMRAAGVTVDLAPVLDADGGQGPDARDADGTRSFSADPATAAADGLAFASGLQAGGIVAVVKHFPGLGGATGNTDAMAALTPPWRTLEHAGLVPFAAAVSAHVPAVMVSNASIPGLTDLPASISGAAITTVLRDQLGYQGLVMTDTLSATALRVRGYSVPEATVAAIAAGADVVLFTAAPARLEALTQATVSALVAAVDAGRLGRSRLVSAGTRILAVKGVDLCPAG